MKTPRELKLQEIFDGIGRLQSELVLSKELVSDRDDHYVIAVYNKLSEARELIRKI